MHSELAMTAMSSKSKDVQKPSALQSTIMSCHQTGIGVHPRSQT